MTLQFSSLSFSNVMHVVILTAFDFTEVIKLIFGYEGWEMDDRFYYLFEKIYKSEKNTGIKCTIQRKNYFEIGNFKYYFFNIIS